MQDISDLIGSPTTGELVPGALADASFELFAQRMALHGNASEAARQAGIDPHNAARIAKSPEVSARIAELRRQERERLAVDVAELEHGVDLIIQQDPADIVDPETGELLPLHKLPARIRRAIAGLECTVMRDPDTGERVYKFKYVFERRQPAQRLKAEIKGLRQQIDITSAGKPLQTVDPLLLPQLDAELRKRLLAPPADDPAAGLV